MNVLKESKIEHGQVEGNAEMTLLRHVESNGTEKILATFITPIDVIRYQFAIVGEGECVYETSATEGLPPIETLNAVRDWGWEVRNLPNVSKDLPDWERLNNLAEIIDTVKNNHRDIDPFVPLYLQRAINVLPVALAIHTLQTILTEEEYERAFIKGIQNTEGISKPDDLSSVNIETLQMVAVNIRTEIPDHAHEELIEMAEERGLFGV